MKLIIRDLVLSEGGWVLFFLMPAALAFFLVSSIPWH
jgi:hypothetical protein